MPYIHDLSPFILRLPTTSFWGDQFGFRWYGFSYLLGFICAYQIIKWLARRQRAGLTEAMVGDFITYAAIGVLVGGRLGYCLFYDPNLFFSFKSALPFWGVLAVNEGGMASHGGVIGVMIAGILFARKHNLNYVYLLDLAGIVGPLGFLFGRIANFINGELVGRIAPEGFKYAVKFPTDILNWPSYQFERLNSLSQLTTQVGVDSGTWLGWLETFKLNQESRNNVYATLYKMVHQIQNGNTGLKEAMAPMLDARYPSQLIAALTEGLISFLVVFFVARKPQKPGVAAATYGMVYALCRIFNEQFREPDLQLGYQLFGLTRGQWLSVGMFMAGALLMFYWKRTQTQTIFGWSRGESVKVGGRR